MPQLVLIDRSGVIRAQYTGDDSLFTGDQLEQNLRTKIEQLVNEVSAPVKKAGIRHHSPEAKSN
jgi:hypothetical protein